MEKTVVSRSFDGAELSIETGWMAGQANGAVWVRQGDTVRVGHRHRQQRPATGDRLLPSDL